LSSPSLLTSSACPDEIVVAMDDVGEISNSREGTVQMDNAPTMASVSTVSLWQTERVGLMVQRRANWRVAEVGAVQLVNIGGGFGY
jgi:hypothetical protein